MSNRKDIFPGLLGGGDVNVDPNKVVSLPSKRTKKTQENTRRLTDIVLIHSTNDHKLTHGRPISCVKWIQQLCP